MDCKLELQNLDVEDRSTSILYATHNFIVYQERNKLMLASCSGDLLSEAMVPIDYLNHECVDLGDALLFLFNGQHLLVLDKSGMEPIQRTLNVSTMGVGTSKVYRFPGQDDQIIFGTRLNNRIQFVNYDFMQNQRITQTSSWNASAVTDTLLIDTTLYAVLDKSTIIAADMSTGELLWTKFETAEIAPGLVSHDKYLLYSCHGMLKKTDGQETKSVRVPLMNINSILHVTDRDIYMTTNEFKNVICYSLVPEKIKWELFGTDPIHESIIAKSQDNADVLVVRTDKYISFINLAKGRSEYNVKTKNIAKLRKTGDHLVVQKSTGTCTLIPGVIDGESD